MASFRLQGLTLYRTQGNIRMQQQFTVTGMTCGHCEAAVKRAIQQLDGAAQVRIDRAQNLVEVQSTQPRQAIAAAIQEEGYAVAA
jgi:copper chaperone